MASNLGRQKRGHDDRRRRDDRDSSSGDSPPPRHDKAPAGRTGLQNYWISGDKIHREVLQRQICLMLGSEARSKPDKYKGVDGYRITAVRPFTERQLEDLEEISHEFRIEQEAARKRNKGRHVPSFEDSRTLQAHDHSRLQGLDHDRHYPPSEPPRSYPPDTALGYTTHNPPMEGFPPQPAYGAPHGGGPYAPHIQGGYPPVGPPYGQPGYTGQRQAPRDFRDPNVRPPDATPYHYGQQDDMDIDPPAQYAPPRPAPGYAQQRVPVGYGDPQERQTRPDPYAGANPYAQPQQNPYGDRNPRYEPPPPHLEPRGGYPPGLPTQDYGGYRAPQPDPYYKPGPGREEKRQRHDPDERRRR